MAAIWPCEVGQQRAVNHRVQRAYSSVNGYISLPPLYITSFPLYSSIPLATLSYLLSSTRIDYLLTVLVLLGKCYGLFKDSLLGCWWYMGNLCDVVGKTGFYWRECVTYTVDLFNCYYMLRNIFLVNICSTWERFNSLIVIKINE